MVRAVIPRVEVRGISATVPERVRRIEELAAEFGAEDVRKISESTGVEQVHVVDDRVCSSDLCAAAAKTLLARLDWDPATIGLVVFVTQTPDYILPATGALLHAQLGLSKSALTIDISQGCSGYVTGLWTAAGLLSQMNSGRALLLVGDTPSKLISRQDRATALLFGDAGSATALEQSESAVAMHFSGGSDGAGACHLSVPTGGFRQPQANGTTPADSPWSLGSVTMNGPEVFAFASREVPPLIQDTLSAAAWTMDEVDRVVFHQANQFLLEHLRKKNKIPPAKFLTSLKEFGNTSSASIPVTLAAQSWPGPVSEKMLFAGFGVGFSWAACSVTLRDATILPLEQLP